MYIWPTRFFLPELFPTPQIVGRLVSGGVSASGLEQVGRTDGGGLWRLDMAGIFLRGDALQAYDAWYALLDGGVTQVVVPKSMGRRAPTPSGVAVPEQYLEHPFPVSVADYVPSGPIVATMSAAALRSTQIVINVSDGRQLRGGEHFAINHTTKGWRRYLVAEVIGVEGTVHTVKIRTPLREDTANGALVDFNGPACVMRVAGMTAPERIRYGRVDVSFVEAF
jgi:hypothetical protein